MDTSPQLDLDDGRNLYDISTQTQGKEFSTYSYVDYNSSPGSPEAAAPIPVVSNVSLRCISEHVPSMQEYFTAINIPGITIFTLGGFIVIVVLILYVDTIKHVLKNAPPRTKTHTAFVLSVYPVVSIVTYCAIVVPRAQLVVEAITQGTFMACLYQLFCLMIAYCGGEAEVVRAVKDKPVNLQVGPCCCYPCCFILPKLTISKRRIQYLRLLVLQLPVVQGLVYLMLLVMWAEEENLYQVNYLYFQPIVITSIFCGLWGMITTMKMLSEHLKDFYIQGKFFVLQLVLMFAKLQSLLARIAVWAGWLPCKPPINPTVYANLIYNCTMLWEVLLLCSIARVLYRKYVPDLGPVKFKYPHNVNVISLGVDNIRKPQVA